MKVKLKDAKQMVVGAQAFRTAIRNREGRAEFSLYVIPSLNIRSSIDGMHKVRVTHVTLSWLIWGAEVYAYVAPRPMPKEGE